MSLSAAHAGDDPAMSEKKITDAVDWMKFDRVIDLTLENERALLHEAQLAAAVAASQYPIFMMPTLSLAQSESM